MALEFDITYDLKAYSHLEATASRPELYLNRYFSPHFYGKLCIVGISQEHPLLSNNEEIGSIAKVEYTSGIKASVIKGKGKKGSMRVMSDTKICTVYTSTGREFVVRAAVRGVLMEWNARLEDDPQLLIRCPEHAFFAIVMPMTDDDAKILSECVSSI